jgi:hypothetical protein
MVQISYSVLQLAEQTISTLHTVTLLILWRSVTFGEWGRVGWGETGRRVRVGGDSHFYYA